MILFRNKKNADIENNKNEYQLAMLRRSQTQNNTKCKIPFIRNLRTSKIHHL